jgi:hypothetical protein
MGKGDTTPPFLTLTLDGDEWSTLSRGYFTPGQPTIGIVYTGGWVSPTAAMDVMEKREISHPCRKSSPDFSFVQPLE